MGDQQACDACGKELPAEFRETSPGPSASPGSAEIVCPKCSSTMPKGVLRCRDCGAYMSVEIEASMLAKQMSRGGNAAVAGYGRLPTGSGLRNTGAGINSTFAEVADDDDFDLKPEVDLLDSKMQAMVDQQSMGTAASPGTVEDDFEMGSGDYSVAVPSLAEEPVKTAEAAPAASVAAQAAAPGPAAPPAEAPPTGGAAAIEAAVAEATAAVPELGTEVPHSVQTAGDVLLDAALEEERDIQDRMKGGHRRLKRSATTELGPDRFLIFCPNGHRVQVHNKHRGRTGRCPNCKSLFFVPQADTNQTLGQAGGAPDAPASEAAEAAPAVGYARWITDINLHRVSPAKLKLKPGSLSAEFEPVDLAAGPEHLLVAVLFTGGGAFRSMQEPKKKAAARQAMLEHFKKQMPVADVPIPKHHLVTPEQLQQLKIAQPTVPGEESLFADVPVFGEGRIAIRVPALDITGERAYLSFALSQFREFSAMLAEAFKLADFGSGTSIPMVDDLQEAKCHYSESVLRSVPAEKLPFYKADPSLKLTVIGRRCQKCGLVVGEDSRKKEKIGGTSDASVAKALCPKCKSKFGDITLYGFPTA